MPPGGSTLDVLGQLCWPYKSLPAEVQSAAVDEAKVDLQAALEDMRKPGATPGLLMYALRRLERARDYGRDPVSLQIDVSLELWKLLQEPKHGFWVRRKCAGALQQKLRGLRKQFLPGRGLKAMPHQTDLSLLERLREAGSWRVVQSMMLRELEITSRGAPLEPPVSAHQFAEALAGLVNELRHWTPCSEADEVVASLEKFMDPSQRSLVLFGRLMLMALPTEASLKYVEDGNFMRWWNLLPRGANSRYALMWIVMPARAAKVRWASGAPRPAAPVLSQEQLCTLLDVVAGTMCLPVDDGPRGCQMDPFTEDCQWAFLGRTTYRFVAKFLVYSLEPLPEGAGTAGKPFAEGSTWAAFEMLCRRLAACTIHSGTWTWHVRTLLNEVCRGYYVRVCRERYKEPGCNAHESFLLTKACDDALVRLVLPMLVDTLTLQANRNDPSQTVTHALTCVARLAMNNAQRWEELVPFVQGAVQDLEDPMSVRHVSTLHLLMAMTPLLVYTAPGMMLEAADLALPGIDPTDPMKTVIAAAFFVNLFVQVPTLDLSSKDLPDALPAVLSEALPLFEGQCAVAGATPGDLQMVTSAMPDLCHNLLERLLEYVQALPKPSKKDAMAALDLAGPRLLSTALFLAVRQGEPSSAEALSERLAEWVSRTLLPNAVKAVGMLISAMCLAYPPAVAKVLDRGLRGLPITSGSLSALGETEALWHLHALGAAARFGGPSLPPRRAELDERIMAALGDKRKAVRRAGAKLCRRILAGLTAPYSGDLTGDGTVEEALRRWAGARSVEWGTPVRPVVFHTPSGDELEFAHALCERCLAVIKEKVDGSDEDIHTALCVVKALVRGVACLYPDERQEGALLLMTMPNAWGPRLMSELSEVLLALCPKLAMPGHPFETAAMEDSNRPNLLCKALRAIVGIVRGERRPEIPDLFQIRGFEGSNVRNHVSTDAFAQKVHFMGSWRDLSRVWYNWEVLTLMNRRLHHRPTGFKLEGVRRRMAELLCGYTLSANSLVSCVATECLQSYLKVHWGAKSILLHDCLLPLQEKTIKGVGQLSSEQGHIAERALQGFARTTAKLFISGTWRRGAAAALGLADVIVRTVHACTEEGKTIVDVRPVAISIQFELIAKWSSAQTAAHIGNSAETCEIAGTLLGMLKQPGVHWRTKVCILATAGSALRLLHLTDKAGELPEDLLRVWIGELIASLASASKQPQMASVAVAELTTAMRSSLRKPGTPLDKVLQDLIPKDGAFLADAAKVLSGLHQGHMGTDSGAVAQADTVQCVVQAATGRVGVPALAWNCCSVKHAWTMQAAFFQTYVAFRYRRGDASLVEDVKSLLRHLQQQPRSEAEDHVVFIEALSGTLRTARRWAPERQRELWAALGPVAADELRTSENNIPDWQFLVYYVSSGISWRLRLRPDAPSEDDSALNLASFLCGGAGGVDGKPALTAAGDGDGEASSHLHANRLRLLQVLLHCLQRRRPTIADSTRLAVIQGMVPAVKQGVSHPYKQVHEESAKCLAMCLALDVECDALRDLRAWIKQRADEIGREVRDAPKDSAVSTACEGMVYVFLHALLSRRLRSLSLASADFLLAAASADDSELRVLAALALNCLAQSPHRELSTSELAQALTDLCRSLDGEDVNSASRSRRLAAAAMLVGSTALRHDFVLRMSAGGDGARRCREALVGLLGDKRVEVRIASQSALAQILRLETSEACKRQAREFAALKPEDSLDRAVHGLGAMLTAAGALGVPDWLGVVIESLSKVAKKPEAKKEAERTVQAFLKQQQQSRDLWKRCQTRLTESQMDLLKSRQGTMSYYS